MPHRIGPTAAKTSGTNGVESAYTPSRIQALDLSAGNARDRLADVIDLPRPWRHTNSHPQVDRGSEPIRPTMASTRIIERSAIEVKRLSDRNFLLVTTSRKHSASSRSFARWGALAHFGPSAASSAQRNVSTSGSP